MLSTKVSQFTGIKGQPINMRMSNNSGMGSTISSSHSSRFWRIETVTPCLWNQMLPLAITSMVFKSGHAARCMKRIENQLRLPYKSYQRSALESWSHCTNERSVTMRHSSISTLIISRAWNRVNGRLRRSLIFSWRFSNAFRLVPANQRRFWRFHNKLAPKSKSRQFSRSANIWPPIRAGA